MAIFWRKRNIQPAATWLVSLIRVGSKPGTRKKVRRVVCRSHNRASSCLLDGVSDHEADGENPSYRGEQIVGNLGGPNARCQSTVMQCSPPCCAHSRNPINDRRMKNTSPTLCLPKAKCRRRLVRFRYRGTWKSPIETCPKHDHENLRPPLAACVLALLSVENRPSTTLRLDEKGRGGRHTQQQNT